jgi:hypothetical protein
MILTYEGRKYHACCMLNFMLWMVAKNSYGGVEEEEGGGGGRNEKPNLIVN